MFDSKRKLIRAGLIVFAGAATALSQTRLEQFRQPKEVLEAYRVCQQFQILIAEDLDFSRAFEATFTTNPSRRREIAITEGEFGGVDLTSVDDFTLINAFKDRMQIFFLMLPLVSPATREEEALFFPPKIKAIFDRKPPQAAAEFAAYALQLKRDAADFRVHLNELARRYPRVSERIRAFQIDLSKPLAPPPNEIVKPLTAYSRGKVLALNEEYYRIGAYAVIREGTQMKIIGIRFFSKLF